MQGLTVGSATGLAVVPLYAEHFGMPFETAIALVVLQTLVICSAFLVFGARGVIGGVLEGPLALLPWVLPTAIAIPVLHFWIRSYKRKFGELPREAGNHRGYFHGLHTPGSGWRVLAGRPAEP